MKRELWIILTLAALFTLLVCGTAMASGSGSCGDNLTWTLTDAGELTISGTGEMTNYFFLTSVPWFSSRSSVKSITIENGVTSLSRYAFDGCIGVTSVTIPASVAKIGFRSFKGCSGLTEAIILNRNAEIGDSDYDVFQDCASGFILLGFTGSTAETYAGNAGHSFANPKCGSNLTWNLDANGALSISGSGGMTYLSSADSAPWYSLHDNISSLLIKDGVTDISRYAFCDCTELIRVTIPISVTKVGYRAFKDCSKLARVTICNSETVIGDNDYDVFSGCVSRMVLRGWPGSTAEIYAAHANITFESMGSLSGQCGDDVYYTIDPRTGAVNITGSGPMWDYTYNSNVSPFVGRATTSAVIGGGVTSVGNYAFNECTSMTSLTIPTSVTSIGNYAFYGCAGLTSVTIPNSVISIGNCAFRFCTSLTSVTIPNSVISIGQYAFMSCTSLIEVAIPDSMTSIGNFAFSKCTSLSSVTIPNSVTVINDSVFEGCTNLTSVTIPNSVTRIGGYAFARTGLTSVMIPNSVTSIGGGSTFYNCTSLNSIFVDSGNTAYTSVDGILYNKQRTALIAYPGGKTGAFSIPNSVTSIEAYAFFNCTGLSNVTIPNSVTSIGIYAFEYCSSLTSVRIPNSVTSIGDSAFSYCTSLIGVSIPNSVTRIGYDAFNHCSSLTYATVHNTEATIESQAFCNTASTFRLCGYSGSTAEAYASSDGHTFQAITAEMGTPDFILPTGLTCIESEAFSGAQMKIVYIPDGVTSLGSHAFANCNNLTQIRIPATITTIQTDVFQNVTISKLTIFGAPGSAAETFANSAGIRFEIE